LKVIEMKNKQSKKVIKMSFIIGLNACKNT